MTDLVEPDLASLLKKAADAPPMPPAEMREQRISFAFGNASLDNPHVTKEMVRDADAQV